ncbi:anti-sigma factor [Arthrobacter sp. PAMC25564]|nr:anti-sigma factor [Arthrobacter sp. PAMC25564]
MGCSGCSYSSRVAGRSRKHVESCTECRARLQRERQYLERLRGAPIPKASDDLTARLLARTGQLAAERQPADQHSADQQTTDQPVALPPLPHRVRPSRVRIPALVAGGAAAALALMAGTAYLMGGAAAPLADGADAAAFLRHDATGSPVAGDLAGNAATGAGAGWTMTGEPDFTPAGALTAGQLASLRSQGWTCPELRELGFHIIWAKGGVVSGENVLELRLTDGRHFVTVLEQHGTPVPRHGASGEQQPSAPVNVLTGHPATADGFTAAGLSGMTRGPGPGSGALWVNAAAPFRAIYQTSGATFTYVADLPAEQADDGVAALVQSRGGGTAAPPAADGVPEQMERGLGRILELLAL